MEHRLVSRYSCTRAGAPGNTERALDSSVAGVRTMREDSLASSHGRSGFPGRRCLLPDASASSFFMSAWAAYVGIPRRYVGVVSPCEEVKKNSQGSNPRTGGHQPENWFGYAANQLSQANPTYGGNPTFNSTQLALVVGVHMDGVFVGRVESGSGESPRHVTG